MTTVTAAEIQKNFGKFTELALRGPVSITRQGREALVIQAHEAVAGEQGRVELGAGVAHERGRLRQVRRA